MSLEQHAPQQKKQTVYRDLEQRIAALIEGESDQIALMASIVCELHNGISYFDWTGFYRVVAPNLLKVGPYQGAHGCLEISFDRGVCGAAARTRQAQIVDDVSRHPDHIACSSTTRSEIVLPVFDKNGQLIAVFDVDSNRTASFDTLDCHHLERILSAAFARD